MLLLTASAYADRAFLTLENDCLFVREDNGYTHGTGLTYVYDDLWMFRLQQNMYTPEDITAEEHIKGDRPYAGWLGAEVGREMFKDAESPWTHYLAVNFGMVGPSAHAGDVQKFIHRIRGVREPKGWDNQLADEFCVNFQWWTKYNWFICDYVAVIPRVGVQVGTLQDSAEIGVDLKIGWHLRKDVGNNRMFSASAPDKGSFWDNVSIYVFAGPDCQYWLYNHMLEGSLFNSNDDELGVHIHPFVGEFQFGAGIDVYNFFARYYATIRGHEFDGQSYSSDYGGLVIGWSW